MVVSMTVPRDAIDLHETGSAFPLSLPRINSPWERILHLGVQKRYKANELILTGDTPPDELMYIHSGSVRCEHPGLKGNLKICFYAESGTIFAETLAINGLPTVASFFAAEDTVVYAFSVKTLKNDIVPNHPDLAFNLMRTMAYKIRLYSLHLESITLNDVCGQICRICYSMLAAEDALERTPGISQQELADILGVHRNTIVRAVRRLKAERIVDELSRSVLRVRSLPNLLKRSTASGSERSK